MNPTIDLGHFRFVLQEPGDALERNPGMPYTLPAGSRPQVNVFDTRYDFTPNGQFVTAYGMDTLLEREPAGIIFDTAAPSWRIDAYTESVLQDWLTHYVMEPRVQAYRARMTR